MIGCSQPTLSRRQTTILNSFLQPHSKSSIDTAQSRQDANVRRYVLRPEDLPWKGAHRLPCVHGARKQTTQEMLSHMQSENETLDPVLPWLLSPTESVAVCLAVVVLWLHPRMKTVHSSARHISRSWADNPFFVQGKLYVRGDSKIFRFQNGKSESLFLQRKNPRRIAWTVLFRRAHKKGISEEVAKKRTRHHKKAFRGVVGASAEVIKEKRSMRPEARKAAIDQAKEKAKAAKRDSEAKKKQEKAKTAAKSAAGQTRGNVVPKLGAKGGGGGGGKGKGR
ncbi:MAG: hypothetical protein Q9159_005533 [Coniocarpon cinnabarinum]